MTDNPTVEHGWQDESPTYTKVRAIRAHTSGCPCEPCEWATGCKIECRRFKGWVRTGAPRQAVKWAAERASIAATHSFRSDRIANTVQVSTGRKRIDGAICEKRRYWQLSLQNN